ncbi:MAG: hypothetical protein JWP89_833 [Schlesneria sp.]|nr:hypothetical protein [Schlesneria sp.]
MSALGKVCNRHQTHVRIVATTTQRALGKRVRQPAPTEDDEADLEEVRISRLQGSDRNPGSPVYHLSSVGYQFRAFFLNHFQEYTAF